MPKCLESYSFVACFFHPRRLESVRVDEVRSIVVEDL